MLRLASMRTLSFSLNEFVAYFAVKQVSILAKISWQLGNRGYVNKNNGDTCGSTDSA